MKPNNYKDGSRLVKLSKISKPIIRRYKKIGNQYVFIKLEEENEN